VAFKLAELFVDIRANDKPILGSLDRVKGGLGKLYGGIAAALGAVGAGAFLYKSIQQASDLNETLSKVGVVFGGATKMVVAQTEEMARQFGLSKQEMLDASSIFGLMAKGAGMSEESAAGFSNQMTKLAGDAMSFYNVPLDVALEKIRAGLSGEAEPLRAFGVFLNDAAVKAEALRMGLNRSGGELTEGQKIMARSSLIMRGMSDAQGDLERTANSPANAQKRLVGTFINSMAEIGNTVMPMWTSLLQVGSDVFAGITGFFQSNAMMFAEWANKISEGINFAGFIVRNFGAVWVTMGLVAQERLINIQELFVWLMGAIGQYGEWFAGNWVNLIRDALNAVWTIFQNVFTNIKNLVGAAWDYITNPAGGFQFEFTPMLDGFQASMAALPEIAAPHLTSLKDQIDSVWDGVAQKEAEKISGELAPAVAGVAGAAKAGEAGAASKDKSKVQSLESFAQGLQSGAMGGAQGIAQRQLSVAEQMRNDLREYVAMMKGRHAKDFNSGYQVAAP
jgi:hypothetical protein